MRHSTIRNLFLSLLMLASFPAGVFAQKFEIHPYAGGFFPHKIDTGDFRNEGIYGVKGGIFLNKRVELEGNFGYINHFEFKNSNVESRAYVWEVAGLYHLPFRSRFQPFVTAGAGGITAGSIEERGLASAGTRSLFKNGDTFFAASYGGGVKAPRLWGPVGLRADVRGRTIPNFRGEGSTWLETTGGLTFSWGER